MNEEIAKELARRAVRKVLANLLDRRGFRQTWDGCDEKTKKEIRTSLVRDVTTELMQETK